LHGKANNLGRRVSKIQVRPDDQLWAKSDPSVILLVEDDDTTRELTATVLRQAGHDVRTARNGRAALTMLEGGVLPAVIFCDLEMPQLDGWAFRRLQLSSHRWQRIPFVVVSALINPEEEQTELRAMTTLRKPVDAEELLRCARLFDPPAATAS